MTFGGFFNTRPHQIQRADLSGVFSGFAQSFAQGRAQALKEKQFKLQKEQIERQQQEANETKQTEQRRVRELMRDRATLSMASKLEQYKDNPDLYRSAYMSLAPKTVNVVREIGDEGADMPPDDPTQISEWAQAQRRKITESTDPKRYADFERKIASLVQAETGDPTMADPQHARTQTDLWRRATQEVLFGIPKAGATRIAVSQGELSKPTRAKSEQAVIAASEGIAALNQIDELAEPNDFTRFGRAQHDILRELDKWVALPDKSTGEIQRKTELRNELDQLFLVYRKWATGVAGGEQEMQRIKESILNKDLSPSEFKGSMRQLRRKFTRAMRLHNYLLDQGIDTQDTDRFMKEMLATSDQWNSEEFAKKRFVQLKKQFPTRDMKLIRRQLRTEGYLF